MENVGLNLEHYVECVTMPKVAQSYVDTYKAKRNSKVFFHLLKFPRFTHESMYTCCKLGTFLYEKHLRKTGFSKGKIFEVF